MKANIGSSVLTLIAIAIGLIAGGATASAQMGGCGMGGHSGHSQTGTARESNHSGHGSGATVSEGRPTVVDGVQVVKVTVTEKGYSPSRIVVDVDEPVRLLVEQWSTSECESAIQIPALKVGPRALPAGKVTEIEFTPKREGTFAILCGMEMSKGTIVVE
jgi:heme/copper-type cytochrome/quinol oxidase subunit 2